jgi:hypothetical protein
VCSSDLDGSEDVGPSDGEYFKTSVINAIVHGRFENYNTEEQTEEIQEQVISPEQRFEIRKIGKNSDGVLPKTRHDAPRKLSESIKNRQAVLGSSNGICKEGGVIIIWAFVASFPEYEIQKGDVFVDAKTRAAPVVEEIMRTTQKEVFCQSRETLEDLTQFTMKFKSDLDILPQRVMEKQSESGAEMKQSESGAEMKQSEGGAEMEYAIEKQFENGTELDHDSEVLDSVDILKCREIAIALIQHGEDDAKFTKKWLREKTKLLTMLESKTIVIKRKPLRKVSSIR